MQDQRVRNAADLFGLFAYLAIVNGGLPDRRLLSRVYGLGAGLSRRPGTPSLSIVPSAPMPPSIEIDQPEAESAVA